MSEMELDTIEEVLEIDKNQMVEALETLNSLTVAAPNKELVADPADLAPEELDDLKKALYQSSLVEDDHLSTCSPTVSAKFSTSSNSFKLGVSWYQHDYTYKYSPNKQNMLILCKNDNKESDKTLGGNIQNIIPAKEANIILLLRDILLSK